MRVRLSGIELKAHYNTVAPVYAIRAWLDALTPAAGRDFKNFLAKLEKGWPLVPPKSEDEVVTFLLDLLSQAGWRPRDKRSSFIPGTQLKPDIWLDEQKAYVEALALKKTGWQQEWQKHCRRTVKYSKHSKCGLAFCTDGRRWFLASTADGELWPSALVDGFAIRANDVHWQSRRCDGTSVMGIAD